MSTNPRSTVVGVFRDRAMAEQAMGALTNAGFGRDQIRYSGSGSTDGTSGGFLADIKSLFTGQDTTRGNFANDLSDLGVSDEEARYYSDEYRNGRSIIAVKAPGREQEAINIMQRYGAYNNYRPSSTGTTTLVQQSPDYVQQRSSTPINAPPPIQQQPQPPQPQPQAARERPVQESQQNEDKLQSLQAQLQETRKQLQEAQAQLQTAKEQEAQFRTTKERETQLESTQKQLQEAQAQLHATQAELHTTQARITQPNQ